MSRNNYTMISIKTQKEYVLAVKQGKIDIEEVIDLLDSKIKSIDTLMKTTQLPDCQDEDFTQEFLLQYYGYKDE